MQPQKIRLPHSGYTVPHLAYTVSSLKQRKGRDGVSFTATLRRNGAIIGTIENDGHGGPDTFYPSAADGYRTEEPALVRYAEQCTDDRGGPTTLEFVLGALVTEYEFARDIKRYATKGLVMLRQIDDYEGDGGPIGMPGILATTATKADAAATDPQGLRRWLSQGDLACGPYAFWQIFNGQRWTDVTDRPAHLAADLFT